MRCDWLCPNPTDDTEAIERSEPVLSPAAARPRGVRSLLPTATLAWGCGAMPLLFCAHCSPQSLTCDQTLTCPDAAPSALPPSEGDALAPAQDSGAEEEAGHVEAGAPLLDASLDVAYAPTLDGSSSEIPDGATAADSANDPRGDGSVSSYRDASAEPSGCDVTASPSKMPCLISEQYGVFVSPNGVDAEEGGTRAAPLKSIAYALQLARSEGKRVYACGVFAEPILIDAALDYGLRIYGNFSCDDWSANASRKTIVQTPEAGQVPLSIVNVRNAPLAIEGFHFMAASSRDPGQSSVAGFVSSSRNVRFTNVAFEAGDATSGRNADPFSSSYNEVDPDEPKIRGKSPDGIYGGAEQSCQELCKGTSTYSTGGRGGKADPLAPGAGEDGKPSQTPVDPVGATGKGGVLTSSCEEGGRGTDGSNAPPAPGGAGATWFGVLTQEGWTPTNGGPGTKGGPGQGGGGGAGGKIAANETNRGGGGGGGCGGCGGSGGQGGKGGGSSFALLSHESSITLVSCTLRTGDAGNGGSGSEGQSGQPGGNFGYESSPGCRGGSGGKGGSGGGGGGGAAGLSVGVGYVGTEPVLQETTWIGGRAAIGGAPGRSGALGADAGGGDGGTIVNGGSVCGLLDAGADAAVDPPLGQGTGGICGKTARTLDLTPR